VGLWEFILGITLVSTLGWVANNWIRARHGYPIEDEGGNPGKRRMDAICAENQELKTQVKRLNERLAVVERIATDPAERTAREIEELR
jgi:hypothetical protein